MARTTGTLCHPLTQRCLERLPTMPRFTVERVKQALSTTFPTASAAVRVLGELEIVTEVTGQKKNRTFSYQACIDLLSNWPQIRVGQTVGRAACRWGERTTHRLVDPLVVFA